MFLCFIVLTLYFFYNYLIIHNITIVKKYYIYYDSNVLYMNNIFKIDNLKQTITSKEILTGNFGLEKEGLRVTSDGKLALTKHPKSFGDKIKNPYITTDFSESQVEIVTPTFNSIEKVYQFMSYIVDIVNVNIDKDEYIWNQSMPCIIPSNDKIPIAEYEGKQGQIARDYRIGLSKKYGTKLQLISGLHYNFSFNENTIEKLHKNLSPDLTLKEFKNELYLKIVRNYLRYKWLVIYLTGCSIGVHESFTKKCINLMNKKDKKGNYYSTNGVSFRNASCGYKNLDEMYPNYNSVNEFINDVNGYVEKGLISEAKELYTQIRLKPKDRDNYLESLKEDGIEYIEIRTIDINPFDKCGISKEDMEFIHLFIIYMLVKEESDYSNWQEESLINEELVAERGFNKDLKLIKDGCEISFKKWATELIDGMVQMNSSLNLNKDKLINTMKKRIENPSNTHAYMLKEIIENKTYIDSQVSIAKNNKETSIDLLDYDYIKKNEELLKYYQEALPNKKIEKEL